MKRGIIIVCLMLFCACSERNKKLSAQEIVDRSIEVSGGDRYATRKISFDFTAILYTSVPMGNQKILTRQLRTDSTQILDVKSPKGFERFINDSLVKLPDTVATAYANALNSVHYFAYLPYGLNDKAVQKRYLETTKIDSSEYHKIEVTFNENGGGDDFDDTYIYWFNTKTFKPEYLAYEFHVDGGGHRFRAAFNERVVGGIRFVDYKNYKNTNLEISIYNIDSLYLSDNLELLSEIKLENIEVTPGSYN